MPMNQQELNNLKSLKKLLKTQTNDATYKATAGTHEDGFGDGTDKQPEHLKTLKNLQKKLTNMTTKLSTN